MNLKGILSLLDPRTSDQLSKHKYIFLCSHMRGYTTLLSHILGNHEEIAGYTENHQSYSSKFNFKQLELKQGLLLGTTNLPEYLSDKVLHNKYKIATKFLHHPNVYSIFMIRKPEKTIKSIINMGQTYTITSSWYKNPERVTDYYIKRIKALKKYANKNPKNYHFLLAEDLINDSANALHNITSFLHLSSPLKENYDTFGLTGKNVFGDPSEKIKEGKIISKQSDYNDILIDPKLLKKAREAYEDVIIAMKKIN